MTELFCHVTDLQRYMAAHNINMKNWNFINSINPQSNRVFTLDAWISLCQLYNQISSWTPKSYYSYVLLKPNYISHICWGYFLLVNSFSPSAWNLGRTPSSNYTYTTLYDFLPAQQMITVKRRLLQGPKGGFFFPFLPKILTKFQCPRA
jgi:hypothetical protein